MCPWWRGRPWVDEWRVQLERTVQFRAYRWRRLARVQRHFWFLCQVHKRRENKTKHKLNFSQDRRDYLNCFQKQKQKHNKNQTPCGPGLRLSSEILTDFWTTAIAVTLASMSPIWIIPIIIKGVLSYWIFHAVRPIIWRRINTGAGTFSPLLYRKITKYRTL